MARPRKGWRVVGPHRHHGKWRVSIVDPDGRRENIPAESEEEGRAAAREAWRQIPGLMNMQAVLDIYERYLEDKGNRPKSCGETMRRLRIWHDSEVSVSSITKAMLTRRYRERTQRLAVDSHRNELAEVKTFWRWCVRRGFVRKSPAEEIAPVGRRRCGKTQLHRSEAKAFSDVALKCAKQDDEGALAALAVLTLGLRSGEIRARRVRDVDAGGTLLWVERGKTAAARRCLEVPQFLAELLERQAGYVRWHYGEGWLFPAESATGYRGNTWLRKSVRRLCRAAGVPVVSVHGLRGTHATLAAETGVTGHSVAFSLGHTNESVTMRHYVEPSASERARTRKILRVVQGGEK